MSMNAPYTDIEDPDKILEYHKLMHDFVTFLDNFGVTISKLERYNGRHYSNYNPDMTDIYKTEGSCREH